MRGHSRTPEQSLLERWSEALATPQFQANNVTLDALITAETQKLEALKTHKKGLMQKLFPSQEESMP